MTPITIEHHDEPCGWRVTQGDRFAGPLTYEEMLGLVACLTMPNPVPLKHWMMTAEETEATEAKVREIINNNKGHRE